MIIYTSSGCSARYFAFLVVLLSGSVAGAVNFSKVYWVNQGDGTLERASLDGGNRQIIGQERWDAEGLAVNPACGQIYWTDVTQRTVISSVRPTGLSCITSSICR